MACFDVFNNSTDPNAPEYGKGWKREHNRGCGCGSCTAAEQPAPQVSNPQASEPEVVRAELRRSDFTP